MEKQKKWKPITLRMVSERGRGGVVFIEGQNDVPFSIARVYYLVDVPGGEKRGAHAHRTLHQCIMAVSGSFDLHLDDGTLQESFHLNKPFQGILIEPGVWRDLSDFSSGAVALVLASTRYDESDYIRDYNAFITEIGKSSV